MQKSLDIFKAEPQSVFDVLCERKQTGFYMPAYQRPYSWEEKHIRDLFSDCENVFRNLLESPDAIIFLGSILSVDDSAATTIYPVAKRHTPTHIKLIIDGQQRLSTLLLIILCLNERLNIKLPKLKKVIDKEKDEDATDALEDLREIVSQLIQDTSNFVIETQAEHSLFKFYPKIIRSQVDCWGKDDKKAQYDSPLAEVLLSYQRHIVESRESTTFKPLDLNNIAISSKRVVDNIKEIRKQLNFVQTGFESKSNDGEENEVLTVSHLTNKDTLDECLDFPIDDELKKVADSNKDIQEIIFISAFSKFLLHRVCLTYVEVNNESYAFDMFEALNTTGEPLTAIETFVPKVIEHIGNKRKNGEENADKAMETLSAITDRFEAITKAKEKNDKTKALILAFVRAYQGKVKTSSLRDQRDSMLKSYESCLAIDKDEYLNHLKKTADFLFDHWQAKTPNLNGLVSEAEQQQAMVCLHYLTDIKHDITQSLLVQFILQDELYETLEKPESSFLQALKAVTAFSVLWRAMSGGADGIDSVYKKLHERGFDVCGVEYEPYQLHGGTLSSNKFNIEKVKAYFRQELENKIISKASPKDTPFEQWLDICSKQQMLTKSKNIRLLILAGFHQLELEGENFVQSTADRNNFLTTSMWELLYSGNRISMVYDRDTADHQGWNESLNAPEVFNKLGNILIDARNNIVNTKNQSWFTVCQKMMQALQNESIPDIDMIFTSEGVKSDEAQRHASILMLERKYAEITFASEWNAQAIEERTQLLLKNAWVNLSKWLA
ncbi:DUF262 domain-containing protein [Vibrio sp. JC009]|uniref:DUF262 domain-containing protein n=1 Tax=Vibrio sp. JC009 TaxID=2912314 RepID=UPI0023AE8DE7|nr:DUF262 domain-containing protein [Vibrio sp. JC009]WED22808.1 DUF262 domain-containing protein [Vibrio sp. JC009]